MSMSRALISGLCLLSPLALLGPLMTPLMADGKMADEQMGNGQNGQAERKVLISNANIIPMDEERVINNQDVLIRGGKIAKIADHGDIALDAAARVIEADGAYLMPGLAEMHAHVPGEDQDEQLRKDVLFLYLSNGVTLARGMLGEPWHLELRDKLAEGDWLGPRLITSGPSLNGNSVESPEEGEAMVREQAEDGYDFLKIHPGLSRAAFDAIAETADEVGINFAGHVPVDVGIDRALEAGYASIDHLDRYHRALVDESVLGEVEPGFFDYRLAPHVKDGAIEAIAKKTAEARVWNVPTETLMHNVLLKDADTIERNRPEFRYLPQDMINGWKSRVRDMQADEDFHQDAAEAFVEQRKSLIKALHDAGAGLLLGSDAPQIFNVPGFSIHHEIEIMEAAGLSPFQILETATTHPAQFFDQASDWGKVKEGMRAELVLLRGNPLQNLDHLRDPKGVMTQNYWLDEENIRTGLREIEERYKRD